MFGFLHSILAGVYLLLPGVMLGYSVRRSADRRTRVTSFVLTAFSGLLLSAGLSLVYAAMAGERVTAAQVLVGAYFAMGMLFLVKLFDLAVRWALRTALFVPADLTQATMTPWLMGRVALAALLRLGIVGMMVLAYVMSSVITYRPKLLASENPGTRLGLKFDRVNFSATDDVAIAGWWIGAQSDRRGDRRWNQWGSGTVLVCHGLGADKSQVLMLAQQLVGRGFNVLAFDFRAHGESGGQLTSFGDLERRDVLGAVRWVRRAHPQESQRICGVGQSLGAAALIAAATDPSGEGRAIEALATYEAYESTAGLARTITGDFFFPPLGWLVRNLGVRLASAQTGADLAGFDLTKQMPALWPRPVLLIHGVQDRLVPFSHAQRLQESATQPQYYLWLEKGDYGDVLKSDGAAKAVAEFFRVAREEPVI